MLGFPGASRPLSGLQGRHSEVDYTSLLEPPAKSPLEFAGKSRRKLSRAARERISAAQRLRWAKQKETAAPKKTAAKKLTAKKGTGTAGAGKQIDAGSGQESRSAEACKGRFQENGNTIADNA